MLAIFRKEINQFFSSPIAYIIMGVFLTAMGLILWLFPDTSLLESGYADMGAFFALTPYLLLFLVPAITMRSIADEVRAGTLEWLLSKPISRWGIVAGSFWQAGCWLFLRYCQRCCIMVRCISLGSPVGNIDSAGVFGAYIGLLLLAGVFVAVGLVGLVASTKTRWLLSYWGYFSVFCFTSASARWRVYCTGRIAYYLSLLALDEQYRALGRGVIDSRNVIYLLSLVVLFLILTTNRLKTSL